METFFWLLRRECREQVVSRRFQWGAVVCLLLATLTGYVRSARYLEAHAERREFEQRWRASLAEQLQRDEFLEVESIRPLSPLTTLSVGLESITPFRFYSTKEGLRFGESRGAHDPVDALLGHLDLAVVVELVISLFTIALCFDTICGERKQGTLSIILSYPVRRAAVLLAKIAATVVVASSIATCSIAIAAATQALMGVPLVSVAVWLSFVGITTLYVAVFATIAVGASVVSKEPANAIVLSLSIWVGAVVLIPRLAAVAINALIPPASAVERSLRLEAAISGLRILHSRDLQAAYARYLRSVRSSDREDVLKEEIASSTETLSVARRRLVDAMLEDTLREEEERDRLVKLIGGVSPTSLFAESASELAMTGRLQKLLFQRQARIYDDEIGRRLVESRHVMHSHSPTPNGTAGSALVVVDNVRPFMIPFRSSWTVWGDVARVVVPNAMILVLMTSVLLLFVYTAFLRLDVRP